jgi:hypothetical protein
MNDPHVRKLHYKVLIDDSTDYNNVPPINEETESFRMFMDGKTATFEMKIHFSTEQEAKALLEDYLKRWEVLIGIEHDPEEIRFRFARADIIDRMPSSQENHTVNLHSAVHDIIRPSDAALLNVARGKYPSLPNRFALSPDVETMYVRYKAYRENREPITTTAYMCLTVLENSAGGRRRQVAVQYNIQKEMLEKLGELCSTKGDVREARKAPKKGEYISLTQKERDWIQAVIKTLIRRGGEWAYDPNAKFPQITMADFPSL